MYRDPAWMLAPFLTGGKQAICVRQPSRNRHGGWGRGRSSIAGKSDGDAADHVRYWHSPDIRVCKSMFAFGGKADMPVALRKRTVNEGRS
jgi:hypothetical protein